MFNSLSNAHSFTKKSTMVSKMALGKDLKKFAWSDVFKRLLNANLQILSSRIQCDELTAGKNFLLGNILGTVFMYNSPED